MNTIAAQHLCPSLADFQQERPHIELELVVDGESDLLRKMDDDKLDMVISAPIAPLPVNLQSVSLYEERYVVVFNDKHRFNRLSEIELATIQHEPYLDRLNCEFRETLRGACLGRQVELYAAYRSNSEEWILGMVRAGIGVALMPEFSVPRRDEKLKYRYLSDPDIRRTVCGIYPVASRSKSEVSEVIEKLQLDV